MFLPFRNRVQAKCKPAVSRFLSDDTGAVTIDWVGLTAGILLLGITLVYSIFNNGVASLSTTINSNLTEAGTNVNTGAAPSQEAFADGGGSPPAGDDGGDNCGIRIC